MAQKENYQWLDSDGGRAVLTPTWLKILTQREGTVLRVYTADGSDTPLGVVSLDDINWSFRTARLWIVAGIKSFAARGRGTWAVSKMLTLAFRELGLHAVHTWIVEGNPSVRIAQRLNFRFIGRQRQSHWIDGRPYDRLWFDILASEHREVE